MKVLVLNCGSSSIKYKLYEMPAGRELARGLVERIGEDRSEAYLEAPGGKAVVEVAIADHQEGLEVIELMLTDPDKGPIASMSEVGACGHRVVHGGEAFTGSAGIDAAMEQAIERYADLAPLHNPPNLTGIRAARRMMAGIPQVACFDTSFHQTIPEKAYLYALPYDLYERFRIRRYGFHGTSHRYVAQRAAEMLEQELDSTDLITCHLGNGCSMAAVRNGRCVDTSMGLTPLEGLVMGTRSGDFDPAIVFYLAKKGFSVDDLDKLCNKQSGLLGISGESNDVRDLESKAASGDARAALALEIFAYRIRKYIGSYLAVLDGCDAIVLTGGIGENAILMRERILSGMPRLGVELDVARNRATAGIEGDIAADASSVKILVVPTDEEIAIARDTYAIAGEGRRNDGRHTYGNDD